jgi:hypothetical protein
LAGIARSGSDDEAVLEALQDSIAEAQARLRLAEDAGDEPSEDLILPVLATLTELAADEDVVTAVAWAREHQDTIAGLKRRIGELSKAIADEEARWGWNDAMQGIYWVIRPDERWE